LNILFVDDEKIIRDGMEVVINWSRIGCSKLVMAENGSRALDIMEKEAFDLVITDIYMQKMSGIELAKEIKERWPMVKVIILSAYEDFNYAREAIAAGVFKYLLKPVTPEELEAAVTEAMAEINWSYHLKNQMIESEKFAGIYRPQLAVDFWKALIRREITNIEDVRRRLQLTGIVLRGEPLCCLVLSVEQSREAAVFSLIECTIAELFDTCVGCIALDHNLFVAVLKQVPEAGGLLHLYSVLRERTAAVVRGACGRSVTEIMELHLSLKDGLAVIQAEAESNQVPESLIDASLRLIHENLNNEYFGVNDIAAALHVSDSYFSRMFKKKMGVTCIEYLTGQRIEKARNLLWHTNMKHETIASAVGYANVHYFSIQFKKHAGETPGQYRKRVRGLEE